MKNKKRPVAVALSAVLAAASAVQTVASAGNPYINKNKDPNGVGGLTISDSIYISQYLNGVFSPTDLDQLDVNDNYVVSDVDATLVQLYDAGVISSINAAMGVPFSPTATISKRYNVYDINSNYKRSYTLSNTENFNSPADTNQVIGGDGRVENWENKGVAKIMGSPTLSGFLGTGFVVGKHTIATAASVVKGNRISSIKLFDGNNDAEEFTPVEYHIPSDFGGSANDASNYALITVKNNKKGEDLSKYMSFNLGAITDKAANKLAIANVGFPFDDDKGLNQGSNHTEMLSTGTIARVSDDTFTHDLDTSAGCDGSPVYVPEYLQGKEYDTVVGINIDSEKSNTAIRIDANILQFFNGNNDNIQY